MKLNCFSHCPRTLATLLVAGATLMNVAPLKAEVDQNLKNTILETSDETVLIEVLSRPVNDLEEELFYKSIACKRLAQIGTEKALPSLESMLADEKLNHYARTALEQIASPLADTILLNAARTLKGQCQADVIDSIGNRKITSAVPLLRELVLTSGEPLVRRSCRETLGKLATDEAINFLLEQTKVCTHCPCLAQGLLNAAWICESDGRRETALKIYDTMRDVKLSPANARAGRYQGLLLRGAEAAETLLEDLKSDDPEIFETALKSVREFTPAAGPAITSKILANLDSFPQERQSLLMRALAERSDVESLQLLFPVLTTWLQSAEESRRHEALTCFRSAGKADPLTVLTLVVDLFQTNEELNVPTSNRTEFQIEALKTLTALPGTEVNAKVLEMLRTAPANRLQLLASIAEEREIYEAAPLLLELFQVNRDAQPIRDRIISAAASLISASNLEVFMNSLECLPIENQIQLLLWKACAHLPQEEAAAVVSRLFETRLAEIRGTESQSTGNENQSNASKNPSNVSAGLGVCVRLLNLQKMIGGVNALACLEKACQQPETMDEATQILGKWSDPATIEASAEVCLKIAQTTTDEKYRIRALRSYIRVPRQFNLPPEKKIAMCAHFFEAASREEDRILVFDVLQRTIHSKSAEAAFTYAKYDFCREKACETVVKIAVEFKDRSPETASVLEKVISTTQNEALKKAAAEQMLRLQAIK